MGASEEPDAEAIRQVMSMMGRKQTPKKTAAGTANLAVGRARLQDADVRAKLSEKQQARRERERQEREAAAALLPPTEPKKMGRPRIHPVAEAPTRGRGRPKKQDAQTTAEASGTATRGTGEAQEA